MVEVTRHNFEDLFPKISHAIDSSDFISIDTEFSGLYYNDQCKPSLFDSNSDRYRKLRQSVQKFTLTQIGITTFARCHASEDDRSFNRYQSCTFHFYLCSLSFGSLDQRFSIQSSSLEFLYKHDFDFNKWIGEGLPFLNQTQEAQMLGELENGLVSSEAQQREGNVREIQDLCSFVASWLPKTEVGDCVTAPMGKNVLPSDLFMYHSYLRSRFSQIWTSTDPFGLLVVERVSEKQRQILEKSNSNGDKEYHQKQLLQMLGFTRVFRLLVQAKKPLVGHNMLMDLMFMYEKFHKRLPESYSAFKSEIHKVFPSVYDTKHMAYSLRQTLTKINMQGATSLQEIHSLLTSKDVMALTLMQPSIIQSVGEKIQDEETAHHAGYDAFLCGSVFLRLCHHLYYRNLGSSKLEPCVFKQYLPSIKPLCNKVNVIRAMVTYVRLDGKDPPSQRPPLLHVATRNSKGALFSGQLAVWFSSYGTVDIQMINSRQAVVATSNFMTARDIITAFKDHKHIRVSRYRFLEHSPRGRGLVIGAMFVATGSCVLLLYNALR